MGAYSPFRAIALAAASRISSRLARAGRPLLRLLLSDRRNISITSGSVYFSSRAMRRAIARSFRLLIDSLSGFLFCGGLRIVGPSPLIAPSLCFVETKLFVVRSGRIEKNFAFLPVVRRDCLRSFWQIRIETIDIHADFVLENCQRLLEWRKVAPEAFVEPINLLPVFLGDGFDALLQRFECSFVGLDQARPLVPHNPSRFVFCTLQVGDVLIEVGLDEVAHDSGEFSRMQGFERIEFDRTFAVQACGKIVMGDLRFRQSQDDQLHVRVRCIFQSSGLFS